MKIILVCNQSCVEKKYSRMSYVFWLQLDRLLAAYKGKNHQASLVLLDVQADMGQYGLSPVTDGMDEKQVKTAVDGIFAKANPDYITLIGAQDIVPFQMLTDRTGGDEKFVASDLPYASAGGYSKDISAFIPPDRAVTRLPDVYGASAENGMDIFIRSVDSCLAVIPQPISAYADIFCLYAMDWEQIMNQTLAKLSPVPVVHKYSSPPYKQPWDKKLLHQPIHYLNLHGGQLDNRFFGQQGTDYPVAIISGDLEGSLDTGAVAVALSCFGGQLFYSPDKLSFVNTYLSNGASLLASTGIAYTGAAEEYSAIFLNQIRSPKKSMPKALLQARLDYIHSLPQFLDAVQQKTIAEFVLYGGCSESYVNEASAEESRQDMKDIKKQIEYIEQNFGVARYNPDLPVPETIAQRIQEDALRGGFTDVSGIDGFDIVSADSSRGASVFHETKQYSVSMTDSLGQRHIFVYTMTDGKVKDVQDYIEK